MTTTNRTTTRTNTLLVLLLSLALTFGMTVTGCEGPAGPQGEQGEVGPIGPAGEDGSVIHAGEGAPSADIGTNGDYYLNQNTGELYGPKDSDGWGEPIIVLKGEDGQDGQDGKDGSQIHSGTGAPAGSLGKVGDFYLDKSSYELYGPKTSSGWGSPLNLKGTDGNANVTRYIFPGYDFGGTDSFTNRCVELNNKEEMLNSAWLYYLRLSSPEYYYSVPGFGAGGEQYLVVHQWAGGSCGSGHIINCIAGSCREYEEIHIVRIEATNTEDLTSVGSDSIIPDHLDVSDYEAVAKYYGFGDKEEAVSRN